MEERNELNDIILNRGGMPNNNRKIILAVATLGVILIIVVMLMNSLTSSGTDNLPQAVLPPEPKTQEVTITDDEPLFEDVEVIQEENLDGDNLDKIAQKLKEESQENLYAKKSQPTIIEPDIIAEPVKKITPKKQTLKKPVYKKPVVKKPTLKKPVQHRPKATPKGVAKYVQVGSFSKYEPNKKFLKSITSKGYKYKYHKILRNGKTINKVLVGPFYGPSETKKALKEIRRSIESGAFVVKI
jgi:DedD protein